MRIMLTGDVVGKCGRRAFAKLTPRLRQEKNIDLVVVNGENAAGGKGLTEETLGALYAGGADIVTGGNHIWDKKEVFNFIDREPYLLRPANYPEPAPGRGWCVYDWRAKTIGVINLAGRTFMPPLDCPFQKAGEILREIKGKCDIVLLDFHAEATSEKLALAWYLDGEINALAGTHTHVQTADERILPKGTAYISDLGMVGPFDSILGVEPELIVERFLTARPVRFAVPDGPAVYAAALVEIDDRTNRTLSIERLQIRE